MTGIQKLPVTLSVTSLLLFVILYFKPTHAVWWVVMCVSQAVEWPYPTTPAPALMTFDQPGRLPREEEASRQVMAGQPLAFIVDLSVFIDPAMTFSAGCVAQKTTYIHLGNFCVLLGNRLPTSALWWPNCAFLVFSLVPRWRALLTCIVCPLLLLPRLDFLLFPCNIPSGQACCSPSRYSHLLPTTLTPFVPPGPWLFIPWLLFCYCRKIQASWPSVCYCLALGPFPCSDEHSYCPREGEWACVIVLLVIPSMPSQWCVGEVICPIPSTNPRLEESPDNPPFPTLLMGEHTFLPWSFEPPPPSWAVVIIPVVLCPWYLRWEPMTLLSGNCKPFLHSFLFTMLLTLTFLWTLAFLVWRQK